MIEIQFFDADALWMRGPSLLGGRALRAFILALR